MRIALVQQAAGHDKEANTRRGLSALEEAARRGANLVCYAELAFERFYPQSPAEPGSEEKAEPVPELDYISIDEEEEVKPKDKRVGKAVKFEQGTPTEGEARRSPEGGKNETFNCPNCGETIMIPSSRRPITLKCPGCKSKGVLRY